MKFDEPILTSVGAHYVCKSYHRNKNPNKSQWTVQANIEIALFEKSYKNIQSNSDEVLWELHLINNVPVEVGISCSAQSPQYQLKISRFNYLIHQALSYWWGYPADYKCNQQDRPPVQILKKWVADGIITKADMARIRNSKICSL